jgi:hypothetical protein
MIETDNWQNIVAIGYTLTGRGGIRIGYENRIVDDLTDRTESNGFLASGWYNWQKRLFARVRITTRSKETVTGTTLVGDEDYTRHLASLKYMLWEYGSIAVVWYGRLRKNPDIDSESDYNSVSSQLDLHKEKYGRLAATYTYYLGTYKNHSQEVSFEFADHLISGRYYPPVYRDIEVGLGGSYYRSRRDLDVEKFSLNFDAVYTFREMYHLRARYEVYNFDDFLVRGGYYTSNIVEISIIREIKL